jgi:hypothetical protein
MLDRIRYVKARHRARRNLRRALLDPGQLYPHDVQLGQRGWYPRPDSNRRHHLERVGS